MTGRVFSAAETRALALAERRRIVETLSGLTEQQWAVPSLCEDWTVLEVAGHVAENTRTSMGGFLFSMAKVGFDHDEYNRRAAARWAQRGPAEVVAALRTDRVMLAFKMSPALLLVDNVVHHNDIRLPLGLRARADEETLAATLTAIVTQKAFAGDAKRVAGTRLVATDIDWQHGDAAQGGPELRGTAEFLIMTIMGRAVESTENQST